MGTLCWQLAQTCVESVNVWPLTKKGQAREQMARRGEMQEVSGLDVAHSEDQTYGKQDRRGCWREMREYKYKKKLVKYFCTVFISSLNVKITSNLACISSVCAKIHRKIWHFVFFAHWQTSLPVKHESGTFLVIWKRLRSSPQKNSTKRYEKKKKNGFPAVPTVSSKKKSPMEGSSEPGRESFQFHEDNWNKDWVVDSMKSELLSLQKQSNRKYDLIMKRIKECRFNHADRLCFMSHYLSKPCIPRSYTVFLPTCVSISD